MTPKYLYTYLIINIARTPVSRALARRAPLLGRRAPVVGRRDRFALAGIGGGGIEATRAGAWLPRRPRPSGRRLRKRDGVAVELARFPGLETGRYECSYQQDSTYGRVRFDEANSECPGLQDFDTSAYLVFEKATGRLRYVFSGFYPDNSSDYMSNGELRAICHAKCDAVEATPLS